MSSVHRSISMCQTSSMLSMVVSRISSRPQMSFKSAKGEKMRYTTVGDMTVKILIEEVLYLSSIRTVRSGCSIPKWQPAVAYGDAGRHVSV